MMAYEQLLARLGGQLAQTDEPIPVRVYEGRPMRVPPCTMGIWAEGTRAWAQFEEHRSLISAADIIELLLKMSKSGGLEIEA